MKYLASILVAFVSWACYVSAGISLFSQATDLNITPERSDAIQSSTVRVYQSALKQPVTVYGAAFASDLSLDLDPPLQVNVDYSITVISPTTATLELLPGKQWRTDPGHLFVRRVKSGGSTLSLPDEGVTIATVLADPVVHFFAPSPLEVQFLDAMISGAGFTNIVDTKLTFHPSNIVLDYHIQLVKGNHTMYLEMLIDNKSVYLEDPEDIIDLRIVTIDTGAGVVTLDPVRPEKTTNGSTY